VKDTDRICEQLKKNFSASVADELIPGILHNLANPLNGILGRSKLLQKRMTDHAHRIATRFSGAPQDLVEGSQKVLRDVDAIVSESDNLFHLFRSIAGKFSAVQSPDDGPIHLSRLIEAEMRFADFYLDFKHDVTKHMRLENDLPELNGRVSDFSLLMTALIRYAMDAMKGKTDREFSISTTYETGHVLLCIRHSGDGLSEEKKRILMDCLDGTADGKGDLGIEERLFQALAVAKGCGARIELDSGRISLWIPCSAGNGKFGKD